MQTGEEEERRVLVYDGPGIDKRQADQVKLFLDQASASPHRSITRDVVVEIHRDLQELHGFDTLVVPGGRVFNLSRKIDGEVVRDWVSNQGGRFVGICAGACLGALHESQLGLGLLPVKTLVAPWDKQVDMRGYVTLQATSPSATTSRRTILGGEVPTLVSLHDSNDSPLRSSAESTPDWYYGDEESGVLVDGRRPAFVSGSSPEVERRGFKVSTVDIRKYEQHLDRPLGFLPRAPIGGVSYSDGDSGQDSNATTSDDDDGDEEGGNEGDDDDDDEEGSSDREERTAVEASNNFDVGREQEPMGGSDGDHPGTRTEQA